jgi:L-threonylcarbamoyladenylate synthase
VSAAALRRWRFGDDPSTVAAALEGGGLLAVPTESSYGLAVDPREATAVARLFALKGRAAGKALPVVAGHASQLVTLGVDLDAPIVAWARGFWPAALTVVAPLREPLPASGGARTLAVRIPAHAGLRELLSTLGAPLTATSANASGEPPIVDPDRLESWLAASGAAALMVDGGLLPGGAPSTLVEWREGRPHVLRAGRFPVA